MLQIHESVERILARREVLADFFYDIFLDRHPEVRPYFIGVDIKRQAMSLTMILLLIEHHYLHDSPVTDDYLRTLGREHQARRHVPKHLYGPFRVCLVETLERFHGTEWNATLAQQWADAIDRAAASMIAGYNPDDDA